MTANCLGSTTVDCFGWVASFWLVEGEVDPCVGKPVASPMEELGWHDLVHEQQAAPLGAWEASTSAVPYESCNRTFGQHHEHQIQPSGHSKNAAVAPQVMGVVGSEDTVAVESWRRLVTPCHA